MKGLREVQMWKTCWKSVQEVGRLPRFSPSSCAFKSPSPSLPSISELFSLRSWIPRLGNTRHQEGRVPELKWGGLDKVYILKAETSQFPYFPLIQKHWQMRWYNKCRRMETFFPLWRLWTEKKIRSPDIDNWGLNQVTHFKSQYLASLSIRCFEPPLYMQNIIASKQGSLNL